MTTHEFALSDLAARLLVTDASLSTLLRDILAVALQELIEAELTATIGAAAGERTSERVTQRNGHRPKLLSTPGGDVEIRIPKLRQGSFFPELLEPRRRIDKALWAVIMTAYVTGTSTRKVDDLVKALGCDSGGSKSTVSRICTQSFHPSRFVAVLDPSGCDRRATCDRASAAATTPPRHPDGGYWATSLSWPSG